MKVDCVRIIEAGYAPATTDEAWMAGVLEPFEPLARGMGLMSGIVDFGEEGPRVGNWVARGPLPDGLAPGWRRMYAYLAENFPVSLRSLLSPDPSVICWSTERVSCIPPAAFPDIRQIMGPPRYLDALGILAAEPSGPSLLVTVPYGEDVTIPPRTLRQLARATAHLCSALRLRRRAAEMPEEAGGLARDVEAVLDPSGRLEHARGAAAGKSARESLSGIVRRMEHARGRLRHTDPEEALAIWLALFDGRWSIVERTETDGRRFLLARRNPPGARDPIALTQGERDVLACVARGHSNKYAGYLLGVAPSTVGTRLESARRKLGLSSRRQAIEMLAGAVQPAP
jgi:DNA-binding CsgD family transcriptional regulator